MHAHTRTYTLFLTHTHTNSVVVLAVCMAVELICPACYSLCSLVAPGVLTVQHEDVVITVQQSVLVLPTLTNYPYSAFEPKPPPTPHPTSTLPMTTHTPPKTSAIAPLASPSRSWVMNLTPSYTVPTLPHSPTLSSSALPALFADMISAHGPHTPHSNKMQSSLGLAPLNSSANTRKHGLMLPPLHIFKSSTHSNLTFPNITPPPLPGPYHPSSLPLPAPPLMIHSARCHGVKVPLTSKKCFSVTYVTPVGIRNEF